MKPRFVRFNWLTRRWGARMIRRCFSTFRFLLALTAVFICVAGKAPDAKADVVYFVSGVFSDGTDLTGSFTINTSGFLESWNLQTVTGATVSGYDYTKSTTFLSGCGSDCLFFGRTTPLAFDGGLQLTFANPILTVAAGTS